MGERGLAVDLVHFGHGRGIAVRYVSIESMDT
jgi:hypothetical protein